MVAGTAVLLLIIYAAVTSQDNSKHGFGAVQPDKPVESVRAKLAEERKQKEKEKEKLKEKEGKNRSRRRQPARAASGAPAP